MLTDIALSARVRAVIFFSQPHTYAWGPTVLQTNQHKCFAKTREDDYRDVCVAAQHRNAAEMHTSTSLV